MKRSSAKKKVIQKKNGIHIWLGSTANYYRWLTDPGHTFLEQDNVCFLCDNTKWAGDKQYCLWQA